MYVLFGTMEGIKQDEYIWIRWYDRLFNRSSRLFREYWGKLTAENWIK